MTLHNLGSVAFGEGKLERAVELYEQALELYERDADSYGVALCELYLGLVAVEAGRHEEAAGRLGRALPVFREMRFSQYAAQCLEGIAAIVRTRGEPREAALLLAAASALRERTGEGPTVAARLRERELAAARAQLGDKAFEAVWSEGRALREETAFDRAQAAVRG